MSELKGYIEATKIEPKLEDITITPSKQEQNFKSKVDGYDKIRVNAIPCETLNVTPKKEKQVIEGMYDKVNVDGISAEILNITPKKETQYFGGLYEKIYVDEIERDNLTVTPSMTEQSFNGLYENVVVDAIETEEVTIDPDFSVADTYEVTATEGKYIAKVTVNKDANLVPEIILEGNNVYGVDGTFKPLDTSDATATAEDIMMGKIAYSNGKKVTGAFVPEKYLIVSSDEPIGDNRTKFWVKKSKNLCDMKYFDETGLTTGAGITSTRSGIDLTVKSYYKNPWCATRLRLFDLSEYAGKKITTSLEIKEINISNSGFTVGTCDVDIGNRKTLIDFLSVTKNDGRVSLTVQIPENITETNQYFYIQLNATGSDTPASYNAYTIYTKIQIEVGDTATEYEAYYDQQLFIKNTDGEYVTFDKDTQF